MLTTFICVIIIINLSYGNQICYVYHRLPLFSGTLFLNTTGAISDGNYLEVVPAGWTFGVIWGTIYVWNAQGLIYCLTTICRRRSYDDQYVYAEGTSTPPLMYVFFTLNMFCNLAWIFVWDRQHIIVAFVILASLTGFLYTAIIFTLRATYKNIQKCCRERGWVVGQVHNAMCFYATWVSVATLINFGTVLSYGGGNVPQSTTCTIILSILTVGLVAWFVADLVFLDKYVRYVLTPYIVLILAFSGSIDKNWNPANTNSIFTACLLGIVCAMLLVKIVVMIARCLKKPAAVDEGSKTVEL